MPDYGHDQEDVARHYTQGGLTDAIRSALQALGKTPDAITVDDLAPVDEFHIGGRQASEDFLDQLSLAGETHVLDIGCGLGGAARFAADRYGCRVTGVDLTPEFVETGRELTKWVGLDDRITHHRASALSMPFDDAAFDAAYMLHVAMNIADKAGLFREVHRVLRPGAHFAVFDVMRTGDGPLSYPVPWAETDATSAVGEPAQYRRLLEEAGFAVMSERNRRKFALDFFEQIRARSEASTGKPALGLHLLMGRNTPDKLQNMVANISAGLVAPVELIASRR